MSASSEKRNRKAAREAGTDRKTIAAQEAAKKQAQSKRRWTFGAVAVVVLIAFIFFLNSGFFYSHTTAVSTGDRSYTPAEVSYRYSGQYYNWVNYYGSYASLFGLDTSLGLAGLDAQSCPYVDGGTWKDYFLEQTGTTLVQNSALLDYAAANGISLDEDETAEVREGFEGLDETVKLQGYGSVDKFFSANYGKGVTEKLALQAELESALVTKAVNEISDSFSFTAQELEDYYQSLEGERDVFEYVYYYLAAETAEVTDADGNVTQEVTDEALAAAKAEAEEIAAAYEELRASEEADDAQGDLDTVLFEKLGAVSSYGSNVSGSALNASYKEWMMGSRSEGDITTAVSSDESGCYVVVFISRGDNHYKLAQVRHILIKAEADEDGNYSDEAKAAAKASAEEILAEWKAGEMTEESFAALAEEYSEDSGSNTNGGLYDHVYKGQMVAEFDEFCFAGHNAGDTAIVYGESSSYAGYHIMYYVGEGELYSDHIADDDLRSEALEAKLEELYEPYTAVNGFGIRFVG